MAPRPPRKKTREQHRARTLDELEEDLASARGSNDHKAVSSLSQLRARLLGLLDVPPSEPGTQSVKATGDPLHDLLAKTRRLLAQAESRGSMVSAERLLKREQEILFDIAARDAEEAAKQRAHVSGETLVDDLVAAIRSLPDDVQARVREAIGA
jgi:hypothetical protein